MPILDASFWQWGGGGGTKIRHAEGLAFACSAQPDDAEDVVDAPRSGMNGGWNSAGRSNGGPFSASNQVSSIVWPFGRDVGFWEFGADDGP